MLPMTSQNSASLYSVLLKTEVLSETHTHTHPSEIRSRRDGTTPSHFKYHNHTAKQHKTTPGFISGIQLDEKEEMETGRKRASGRNNITMYTESYLVYQPYCVSTVHAVTPWPEVVLMNRDSLELFEYN